MVSVLPYVNLDFEAVSRDDGTLPVYLGSTLRGAVASRIKKYVCVVDHRDCRRCHLRYRCFYPYLFEPPPLRKVPLLATEGNPPALMFIPPDAPHDANHRPRKVREGDRLTFRIRLFGSPGPLLDTVLRGVRRALFLGLGRRRIRFDMVSCIIENRQGKTRWERGRLDGDILPFLLRPPEMMEWDVIPEVLVEFITPFRFKQKGGYRFTGDFRNLMGTILRRYSRLCMLYGRYESYDYSTLLERAGNVECVEKNLRWLDWVRFSRRQWTKMKLGGMVGRVKYRNVPMVFYRWLKVGEIIHTGKNTIFGLGRIRVERWEG